MQGGGGSLCVNTPQIIISQLECFRLFNISHPHVLIKSGFVYEGKSRVKVEDSMLFVSAYEEHPLQRHIACMCDYHGQIRLFGCASTYYPG